jgi:cytoskeletal protein RodZ
VDLGSSLQQARERAGFSIPELFARTRIPMKTLRAIEENNFAAVPRGIFARSFIRTFAREVGLDPAAAVAQYRAMMEPADEQSSERPHPQEAVVDDDLRSSSFDPELLKSRPDWGYALIAAAVIIWLIAMNRDTVAERFKAPVVKAKAITAETVPVDTRPTETVRPAATTGTGVRLEMRAEGWCWIKAVADGQTVFARLLQPGETQTVSAQGDLVLRVGDPAALSYSINGRPGRALGEAQIPVTIRVNADGELSTVS